MFSFVLILMTETEGDGRARFRLDCLIKINVMYSPWLVTFTRMGKHRNSPAATDEITRSRLRLAA
ncbi:hypothetical protein DENIT_20407 [Pseudomonas veronii]|nr:hypothetical protein DENIT_20407 [Pseudomonas veronii]